MRIAISGLLVASLTAGLAVRVQAAEKTDPRAIIQKAIQVTGGEEKLAKYKSIITKGKCRFYGPKGRPIVCTAEWFQQPPRELKAVYHMEMGGKKITRIEVVRADRGWSAMGGKVSELSTDQLADIWEGMEAEKASTLVPLKDPMYQITSLAESAVADRPAVGLKVVRQGHRDVLLYFDKEQGYLVKMQTRAKVMGKDVDMQNIYGDYRDFDGIRTNTKLTTTRDGKPFLECEITEYKAVESIPKTTFGKPQADDVKIGPAATSTH
jgi:hypothetical protein